jgi:hypothetical protein
MLAQLCARSHGMSSSGDPTMTFFHQPSTFAAPRGEGLHPKLQALLDRNATSPFSEISMRQDGLTQAGPSPNSEVYHHAKT